MKSVFLFLTSLVFCIMANAETTPATSYAGGSGTSTDPYQIATLAQLRRLSETSADWSKYFVLTADINASDTKTWNSGAGYSAIGTTTTSFTGQFDGQQYTISGLYINRPSTSVIGLFGKSSGATIKNIGLTNVDFTGDYYVGGLVGYSASGTYTNCYVAGTVNGIDDVGGLIGNAIGTVNNSYSEGTVTGNEDVGGFIGSNAADINSCYSTSDVEGNSLVGGFVGNNIHALLSNCFATGKVIGSKYVGEFTGASTGETLTNCYAIGVNTPDSIPRFIGYNYSNISNCFYQKSGTSVGIGTNTMSTYPSGLTIANFASESTFTNWNFTDIWIIATLTDIDPNPRPYLRNFLTIYEVTYTVDGNKGSLVGDISQSILPGKTTTAVEAIPNQGYYFVEWQDENGATYSTNNPLTITNVTSDLSLKAVFNPYTYSVNFTSGSNGTLSGDTIQTVAYGSSATAVTAVPDNGYEFVEWRNASGNSVSTSNPLIINVEQDSTLTAIFDLIHYTISFSAGENGSITPLGDSSITVNEAIHCTITPNTGYVLDNVTYNGVSIVEELTENSNASYSYDISSVSADVTIEATFREYVEYTITASSGEHGSISPEGAITVTSSVKTFEFTPDEGYVVSKVILDDNAVPFYGNSYTLNDINADHTLYVEFEVFDGILSFYPERDAHIYKNASNADRANTNYGLSETIIIKCEATYGNYWKTLIHFSGMQDVFSSLDLNNLGDTIKSVKLDLFFKPDSETEHSGDNAFNVYNYNKDWEETGVTWNNAPVLDEDASYVQVPASTSSTQDYSIDITDIFFSQYKESDGSAGFWLDFVENIGTKYVILASKEYGDIAYAPRLRIYIKGYDYTEVNTITYKSLSIYPNPTTGIVYIPLPSGVSNAEVLIYNITGTLVYSNPKFDGGSLDLTDLQAGVYVIRTDFGDSISINKLIKKE